MKSQGPLIVVVAGVLLAAFMLVGFVWAASGSEPNLGDSVVVSPSGTWQAEPEGPEGEESPSPTATPTPTADRPSSGESVPGGSSATATPPRRSPAPEASATPAPSRPRAEPVKPPPPKQGGDDDDDDDDDGYGDDD